MSKMNGKKTESQLYTTEDVSEACPGLKLNPYQLVGVNWMGCMRSIGLNGVLADEMGLGKTVQTICFFALLRCQRVKAQENRLGRNRPHLVVAPSSVLGNWRAELSRFCPALEVMTYHGSAAERQLLREGYTKDVIKYEAPDVVLCTYTYWERDSSIEDRKFLKSFDFDYVVLDEGHSIKNSKGHRFQRLNSIRSTHRMLLSGTPVQNNLAELMALLSYLMPKLFTEEVTSTLLEKLERGNADSPSGVNTNFEQVRNMLAPFVMRRLKADVLDQLVPKKTEVVSIKLNDMQRGLYDGILGNFVKSKAKSGVPDASESKSIFTDLRKAANHPLLLQHYFKDKEVIKRVEDALHSSHYFGDRATLDMVRKELQTYGDYDLHQVCVQFPSLKDLTLGQDALFNSAKISHLHSLLPRLKEEGHRILLFSQWTRVLDVLQLYVSDVLGFRYSRLDGSTPVAERKRIIDDFSQNRDIPIFLLSTRAGGLGINLTCADTVILHDLDFNPENDKQAEDRCHRIGQTKPVTVIKLVAEGTVDEDIFKLGQKKQELNRGVLQSNGGQKSSESATTISGILSRACEAYIDNAP
ncbi:unnamed protein product [Chrysoparadoxa australica]